MVEIIVNSLVALTILAQAIIIWIIAESLIVASNSELKNSWFLHLLKRKAIFFGFLISLVSMLGSLFYSEIMNFSPCVLCWYERIFMYSQVFLFGIALIKRESKVFLFATTLSIIGALISAWHYYIQLKGSSAFCGVVGYSASCTETFSTHLGYITIPLMCFTAFILILMISFVQRKNLLN